MDGIIAPYKLRAKPRSHLQTQYTLTEKELGRESNPYEEEDHVGQPSRIRERTRRSIMSNSHRRFHRRAPQAGTRVLTVNVEVFATLDSAGNVVAQATVTQTNSTLSPEATQVMSTTNATTASVPSAVDESSVPTAITSALALSTPEVPSIASLPSETQSVVPSTPADPSQTSALSASAELSVATVVAVPSVPDVSSVPLPSVPSVPGFPGTLTVPAYPFASSSFGLVAADAVSASSSVPNAASSSSALVVALTAVESINSSASSISGSTSLATSSLVSSPTPLPAMSGFTYSASSEVATAQSAISFESSASDSPMPGVSSTASVPSYIATPTHSLDAAGSSSFYGSGGPGWNAATGVATTGLPGGTTAAYNDAEASGITPLDTPQVVGSVVGSLAGAAFILAIILILIRRHKRRQNGGALQLTDDNHTDNEQAMRHVQAPAPARASLVPSAFLNRFSGLSKSSVDTSSPTERSFQRVSGRKLPSAFSEGMTSDQFSRGGTMSGSSFYQDDHGTYGGPGGLNKEYGGDFGKEIGGSSFTGGAGTMNLRPSPARTPVIRHPDENPFSDTNRSNLSPPVSPNPFSSSSPDLPPRTALGRSLHSADGSRSSRFTENV